MSHQPFEKMIFDRENLGTQDVKLLKAHLRECQDCADISMKWSQLDKVLRDATQIPPTPGFSQRFQDRLVSQRRRTAHLQYLGLSFVLIIGLTVTAVLLGLELLSHSVSMSATILRVLLAIRDVYIYLSVAGGFVVAVVENTVGQVPPGVWLFISSSLSFVLLVWMATIYRFSFYQIRKE